MLIAEVSRIVVDIAHYDGDGSEELAEFRGPIRSILYMWLTPQSPTGEKCLSSRSVHRPPSENR